MGSMIINGLLDVNAVKIEDIIISSRTKSKLNGLILKYPQIKIAENNISLAKASDKIFLFVNTGEVKNVIGEIKDHISHDIHIIHISAGLSLDLLETIFSGKISRIIPSLTSEVGEGVSLICHNKNVTESEKNFVEDLFGFISSIKVISEDDFEVGSDLTSCAPAFMAYMMMSFARSGTEKSNLSPGEAEDMVIKTLYGTAKLLVEKEMSFEEVISRVATKGGITEEGIKLLEKELPPVFIDLFEKTLNKHEKVKANLKDQYY
jgi:pyrroline-5-carboxylate reductase